MNWIRSLLKTISVTEVLAQAMPTMAIRSFETVVGELPDELRRFRSHFFVLESQHNLLVLEHRKEHEVPGHTRADCLAFLKLIRPLRNELKLLNDLFWQEVHQHFQLDGFSVGVRKDWQVVRYKDEDSPDTGEDISIIAVDLPNDLVQRLKGLQNN